MRHDRPAVENAVGARRTESPTLSEQLVPTLGLPRGTYKTLIGVLWATKTTDHTSSTVIARLR